MATWNQNCSVSLLGFGCSCFELLLLRGGGWKSLSPPSSAFFGGETKSGASQASSSREGQASLVARVCVRLYKKVSRLPPPPFWNLHFPNKYPAANRGEGRPSALFHVGGDSWSYATWQRKCRNNGFKYFPERWQCQINGSCRSTFSTPKISKKTRCCIWHNLFLPYFGTWCTNFVSNLISQMHQQGLSKTSTDAFLYLRKKTTFVVRSKGPTRIGEHIAM